MIDLDELAERTNHQIRVLRGTLELALAEQCPGEHKAVQHRDGKPPWCVACHRTANGVKIGDLG